MEPISLNAGSTESSEKAEITASVGSGYKEHSPLFERFGIGTSVDERVNRNLATIWQWAKSRAETQDKDSILWQVTKLNTKLGDAHGGSAPYTKVLNYISEYNRMVESEKRLREMEAHE
jgi:hypothetical protein